MDGHDAVVHFAAESHVDRSIQDGSKFVRTNCIGTNVLCDVANTVGVGRFLHISTDEVYGSVEEGSSLETDVLAPRSPYSAAKAGSDLIALSYYSTYGLPVVVTRCSNNYGALPVPREGHPAVHHQPARRQAGAAVRRRAQRARLDPRRGPQHRRPPRARAGERRRDLQHRRRQRAHQSRAHVPAPRADRAATSRSSRRSRIGSGTTVVTR